MRRSNDRGDTRYLRIPAYINLEKGKKWPSSRKNDGQAYTAMHCCIDIELDGKVAADKAALHKDLSDQERSGLSQQ